MPTESPIIKEYLEGAEIFPFPGTSTTTKKMVADWQYLITNPLPRLFLEKERIQYLKSPNFPTALGVLILANYDTGFQIPLVAVSLA